MTFDQLLSIIPVGTPVDLSSRLDGGTDEYPTQGRILHVLYKVTRPRVWIDVGITTGGLSGACSATSRRHRYLSILDSPVKVACSLMYNHFDRLTMVVDL